MEIKEKIIIKKYLSKQKKKMKKNLNVKFNDTIEISRN